MPPWRSRWRRRTPAPLSGQTICALLCLGTLGVAAASCPANSHDVGGVCTANAGYYLFKSEKVGYEEHCWASNFPTAAEANAIYQGQIGYSESQCQTQCENSASSNNLQYCTAFYYAPYWGHCYAAYGNNPPTLPFGCNAVSTAAQKSSMSYTTVVLTVDPAQFVACPTGTTSAAGAMSEHDCFAAAGYYLDEEVRDYSPMCGPDEYASFFGVNAYHSVQTVEECYEKCTEYYHSYYGGCGAFSFTGEYFASNCHVHSEFQYNGNSHLCNDNNGYTGWSTYEKIPMIVRLFPAYQCPSGTSSDPGAVKIFHCQSTQAGMYLDFDTLTLQPCVASMSCPLANSHFDGCGHCVADENYYYAPGDSEVSACPVGSGSLPGARLESECISPPAGFFERDLSDASVSNVFGQCTSSGSPSYHAWDVNHGYGMYASFNPDATFSTSTAYLYSANSLVLDDSKQYLYFNSYYRLFRLNLDTNQVNYVSGGTSPSGSSNAFTDSEFSSGTLKCGTDVAFPNGKLYGQVVSKDGKWIYSLANTFFHGIVKCDIDTTSSNFGCCHGWVGASTTQGASVATATGTAARFRSIQYLTRSPDGNYIALWDSGNYVIRQIEISTRIVTEVAGTRGSSTAQGGYPGIEGGLGTAKFGNSFSGINSLEYSQDGKYLYFMDAIKSPWGQQNRMLKKIDIAAKSVTNLFTKGQSENRAQGTSHIIVTNDNHIMFWTPKHAQEGNTIQLWRVSASEPTDIGALHNGGDTSNYALLETNNVCQQTGGNPPCSAGHPYRCYDGALDSNQQFNHYPSKYEFVYDKDANVAYFSEAAERGRIRKFSLPGVSACPDGLTSALGTTSFSDCVQACSAGSYGVGGSDCTSCPANSNSLDGATTVDDCFCNAGYVMSGGSCAACSYADDEYQPDAGQTSCLTCPANASPPGDAATACQCDAGYTGAPESCSACGAGFYKASPGPESCTECPANTESGAASTSINDCECMAGTEAPANGQACTECPAGEYKQATGASDCISCGTGATTLLPRSDDPSECVPAAGYTGAAGGPFTECAVGSYKSSAGTGPCTTCYAHSTTSGTGSTSIDACSCVQPAYADDADGLDLCDCGAGYYWDGAACVQCEANSFCIGGDTSTAVQTACSTVDANSVSPAGSDAADDCVCDVGFKQGATCEACAEGSYSDQVDSASCSNCGANLNTYDTSSGYHTSQATAATGADAESDCLAVPNFYKSGTAGHACPSNTWTAGRVGTVEYGSGIVSEHCVCQAGHYYSGDVYTRSSSDGCSVCPAGSYCPGGVFDTDLGQWTVEWEAQLCTAGAGGSVDPAYQHLTSDGGATAISRDDCYCKAGYVGPNGQANGCNECAVGSYCPGGEVAASCPSGATSPAGSDEITDCVCEAGFYGPDGEDCFTCPAGSYCPGGTVVTTCPAGSSSLPGAESILACLCNAGFTGPNGGPCTACEVGTYKPLTGPDTCTDCPSFTSSPAQSDEHTDCTCVAGYTGPDGQSCVACNPGEYKDVTGSSACQACTANSMSEAGAPTADSCLCDPGYTGTGSGECTICSANFYKELAGPAACDACPTHSTSPAGSDEAEDCVCDAGYSGVNGGTCTACPPGKYCVQGEANPSSCPTNALTIEALADDVSDCVCDLGYSGSINTITDQCLECNAGFYNDEYDGVCNQCPQHSSSSAGSTAATDCKCIPGATGADGGPCTLCGVGEYKVGSGSGSCDTCPQHSTSEAGSDALLDCRCQKGYTGPDGEPCFPCNAGQYKDAVGNAACSPCPDFTQSPAGSDELTDCTCIDGYVGPDGAECGRECPPGFEPGPANLRCVGCTPGTYKPTEGDEECTACPANSDHIQYNQTSHLVCDCVQGYIKDEAAFAAGSVQCSECPDGSFGNHNFENICHQCYAMVDGVCSPYTGADHTHCPGICQVPAGYQVTASGNNLELCPVGTYNLGGSTLQCQACPAGSVNADVVGATSLAACLCLPGYARTDLNAACQPCGAGTYKDSLDVAGAGGMGTCSACPADSSSLPASDALTDCKCNAGFTGADGGACTGCEAGTYKVLVGSSACLTCPDHSSSPAQSTAKADCVCDAGAAGPSGGPCELCAIGSFSDTAGSGACTPCGSDTTTQGTGSDARSDCLCATGFEGHPTNGGPNTASGSCVPSCAAGQTYSDAAAACVACAADTYKVATGAHSCTACADPRNASAVGSDELADCTCREGEMGLFGPAVAIVTALGSYNLPKTHAGSITTLAAADSHRLKDITFSSMAGAGVAVTVLHSGTTLTLFSCEPRDCADKTVQLYGLRGTLSVSVTAGSPAWSVDVWEGRGWTAGTPHDSTSLSSVDMLASTDARELTVGRDISKLVLAFDLTVGDHVFTLEDGAPVYHEPAPGSEPGQFVCAPCPPGVICGAPVPYP